MKTNKTKPKSNDKATDQQLMLEGLKHICDAVALTSVRIDMLVERVDELTKSRAPEPAPVDRRPKLNWHELEPEKITWSVFVDPATIILTPGTHLRYDVHRRVITTYDGVTIGSLQAAAHRYLAERIDIGDKLHVYLTTARKLGIKLGRPA